MILFNLTCSNDHQFEAWFKNGDSYSSQEAKGIISCPMCGGRQIRKSPMAPSLSKGIAKQADAATSLRQTIERHFENVGDNFADEARQIHYGEVAERPIRGQTTLSEAKALLEEGIAVLPLPFVVEHDS